MRNILITVMMLIVVVVLFVSIINSDNGVKHQIEEQGNTAVGKISEITISGAPFAPPSN